jgi:hypothetical protein
MSAKRTVTSFRSACCAEAGSGVDTDAVAVDPGTRLAPHSLQNFAPGLFWAPQFGQPLASADPHSLQNFEPDSFSLEQTGQITR